MFLAMGAIGMLTVFFSDPQACLIVSQYKQQTTPTTSSSRTATTTPAIVPPEATLVLEDSESDNSPVDGDASPIVKVK
eukprot:UN26214